MDHKIKWGVIGCGGIANKRTIPGMLLAENAALAAVMDINAALANEVGEKYRASAVCTSVEELLRQDIDAVYIATPVFLHKDQAIAAMRAGKHVLVEKPAGIDSAEIEAIKQVSREEHVKLGVGMLMRFHSQHQKMKELIADGKLGEIVSMRAQWAFWYPDMEGNWRQNKKLSGGGALMDVGVHCIDLLMYISGLKADCVSAFCDTQTFRYHVDDHAGVFMRMNQGAHAYVDVSFNIPEQAAIPRVEIYGTKGSMIAENTCQQETGGTVKVTLLKETGGSDAEAFFLDPAEGNLYTREIESFSRAIAADTAFEAPIEDALAVQNVIDAAYRSSECGRSVDLQVSFGRSAFCCAHRQ